MISRSDGLIVRTPGDTGSSWRADAALFGYALGPHSWKRFLHPPIERLWQARREGDDHMIRKPGEVYADSANGALLSFEIIDADGVSQIILLREPLMLAPPTATG